jgi:hypothetical protein
VRSFASVFPTAEEFLALSPRQLAPHTLVLMNEPSAPVRQHPKNLRNGVVGDYPSAERAAVDRLIQALRIMNDEGYTTRDYADAVDNEWFVLTEKGRAVRDPHALDLPESRLASQKPLIFISCGQFTENEKALGSRIVRIIEDATPLLPTLRSLPKTSALSTVSRRISLRRCIAWSGWCSSCISAAQ